MYYDVFDGNDVAVRGTFQSRLRSVFLFGRTMHARAHTYHAMQNESPVIECRGVGTTTENTTQSTAQNTAVQTQLTVPMDLPPAIVPPLVFPPTAELPLPPLPVPLSVPLPPVPPPLAVESEEHRQDGGWTPVVRRRNRRVYRRRRRHEGGGYNYNGHQAYHRPHYHRSHGNHGNHGYHGNHYHGYHRHHPQTHQTSTSPDPVPAASSTVPAASTASSTVSSTASSTAPTVPTAPTAVVTHHHHATHHATHTHHHHYVGAPRPHPSPAPVRYVRSDECASSLVPSDATLVGAGILPFCISPCHSVYFLVGLERDFYAPIGSALVWSDFGGRRDPEDAGPAHTATRELREESLGMVTAPPAERLEAGQFSAHMLFLSRRRRSGVSRYDTYLVQTDFDATLPRRFARKRNEMERQGAPPHLLEKTRIQLVSAERLRVAVCGRGPLRLRGSFVARARAALDLLAGVVAHGSE